MEISEEELTQKLNAVASEAYHLALSRFKRRLRMQRWQATSLTGEDSAMRVETAYEWCVSDVPDAECLMEAVPCRRCTVSLQVNDIRKQELTCLACIKQLAYPELPY